MNNEDYNVPTLLTGVGVAIAIVAVAIIILNAPEILEIIKTEGLLN